MHVAQHGNFTGRPKSMQTPGDVLNPDGLCKQIWRRSILRMCATQEAVLRVELVAAFQRMGIAVFGPNSNASVFGGFLKSEGAGKSPVEAGLREDAHLSLLRLCSRRRRRSRCSGAARSDRITSAITTGKAGDEKGKDAKCQDAANDGEGHGAAGRPVDVVLRSPWIVGITLIGHGCVLLTDN